MKTYKKLWKKLYSYENLFFAYKKARKGRSKKYYVIEFEKDLRKNLLQLQKELIEKTYSPKPLKKFIIRDPKTRKIFKSSFRDRIIHHAIVNILNPIYEKIFIYDSYASRKNKGHHKAIKRFDYFKRKVSQNGKKLNGIKDNNYICGYCFKADIKHYFDTVNHNILIKILKRKVRNKDLIWLIKKILKNFGNKEEGMPLGNLTSQFFANVYLNDLDYFVKYKLKTKYYIRYVDDFIILYSSKEKLEIWKKEIDLFLKENLKLKLHAEKSKIIPLHKGVHFLGFRISYYYKLLNKTNIYQINKNLDIWFRSYNQNKIDYKKIINKLEGWFAHAIHGNTYNLRKQITSRFNKMFIKEF